MPSPARIDFGKWRVVVPRLTEPPDEQLRRIGIESRAGLLLPFDSDGGGPVAREGNEGPRGAVGMGPDREAESHQNHPEGESQVRQSPCPDGEILARGDIHGRKAGSDMARAMPAGLRGSGTQSTPSWMEALRRVHVQMREASRTAKAASMAEGTYGMIQPMLSMRPMTTKRKSHRARLVQLEDAKTRETFGGHSV